MTSTPSAKNSWLRPAFLLSAAACIVLGLVARWGFIKAIRSLHPPNWHTFGPDIFYYLLGTYEPIALGLVAAGALFFALLQVFGETRPASPSFSLRQTLLVSAAVFLFCLWGSFGLYHRFPLSMDENAALYQASIFSGGHVTAPVPPEWESLTSAAVPEFIVERPGHALVAAYLPVYAALLALVGRVFGSPWVLNPLLSADSVLLLYGIGRNLGWPKTTTAWAVLFLATSSQFLINGLSGYAMTCHLAFSLAWLFLFTHPDKRLFYLAPPLGVLAIGVHQPVCHIIFVLPFLLRLLLERRWWAAAYSAVIYLVGGLLWIAWMRAMRPEDVDIAQRDFIVPGLESGFIFSLSLLLLISWQNVLMVLGFVAGLARARSMPPFVRDLLYSAGLTLAFYLFFSRSQGSGWGYRYMFPVLGNLALIAAWGASQYSISRASLVLSVLLALGLQLPFRCAEVHQVLEPQRAFFEHVRHIDADYVILDRGHAWIWYSAGFVRNQPDFKNRPLVFYRERLSDDQIARLQQTGKTVVITPDEESRDFQVPLLR